MKNSVLWCVVFLFTVSFASSQAPADVTLSNMISSHMVLQRDRPLPIWGWADPGEAVAVKLDEATATAKADAQGNWKVVLPAVKADGKTHTMTVSGKNKIVLEDILIGDVWIGSGQSNMAMNLESSAGGKEAVAAADCPQIRLLYVAQVQAKDPAKDIVPGLRNNIGQPLLPPEGPAWKVCSPKTVPLFSAVLYYYGQRLHKELDVPIGLIDSQWGGMQINMWKPGWGIYNGMIAPLAPFAIRGTIWYQGEGNIQNGMWYAGAMKEVIEGWRKLWGYDFPFYYVQIAPYAGYAGFGPYCEPELWEAQAACLKIPATGMAVTTDLVDDIKDQHPKNKRDVGNRLALWALAKEYKKDLVYSGPLYKAMKVEDGKVRLSFAHVGGGLKSRDGKALTEFEIAGADGKFVPAEAAIDGDTVVVQAKEVAAPTQVRFGWRNEANPNLANKEGLPASPFRTSNWQGGTGE